MEPVLYNNIPKWIKENKSFFNPPVCNKMMHQAGQLKVFYVGGPNLRKDFHLEEGEELFYMVKGDMKLITMEANQFKDVIIKEGEVFLLPGKIPHSPQRFQDTIGLVVERERLEEELDCVRYFVEGTTEILFERWFYCEDLGSQLGPIIKDFFTSEEHRTGKPIPGEIRENPPNHFHPDSNRRLDAPFSLSEWTEKHREEINEVGSKRLFDLTYTSDILVIGQGEEKYSEQKDIETWLWQLEGQSELEINGKVTLLKMQDSYLIPKNAPYKHTRPVGSITLSVQMDPCVERD